MRVRVAVGLILLAAIVVGASYWLRPQPSAATPDTVYVKMSEKSAAVADGTTKTVTRWRTLIDTLPGDTIYVPRVQIETLLVKCEACAEQLRTHRRISDSIIKVRDDTIAALRTRLASCSRQKPWFAVGGALTGALLCKG